MKKINKNKEVDLHGVRHHRVRSVLIPAIEELWDSGEKLEIITGHSNRMKEIVKEVLKEYKLKYEEDAIFNPGRILTKIE